MLRAGCFSLSLMLCQMALSAPIDEFRISDIERQINELQTTVREQTRVIAQLQQFTGRPVSTPSALQPVPSTGTEVRWLTVSRWQQLKPGMTELQVIELLGAPTQLRSGAEGQRQLLYAIEIGRSGFLSGNVTVTQGTVSAIEMPALR